MARSWGRGLVVGALVLVACGGETEGLECERLFAFETPSLDVATLGALVGSFDIFAWTVDGDPEGPQGPYPGQLRLVRAGPIETELRAASDDSGTCPSRILVPVVAEIELDGGRFSWNGVSLVWSLVEGESTARTPPQRMPISAVSARLDLSIGWEPTEILPREVGLKLTATADRIAGTVSGSGPVEVDGRSYGDVEWSMLALCSDCAGAPPTRLSR